MPKTVSVKCVAKDVYDSALKPGLIKTMTDAIKDAIDKKSGGKLTAKGTSADGIILTATLVSLTADNKSKPSKLEGAVTFEGMKSQPSVKTFKSSKPATGSMDGVGSNVQAAANQLIGDILDVDSPPMKTLIKSLLSL